MVYYSDVYQNQYFLGILPIIVANKVFYSFMTKNGSKLSNVLKTLMFKKNIRTSQLARNLELPQQTLQRIVSGTSTNPHTKTLKPIADFFGISIDQLKGTAPLPESVVDIDLPSTKPKARAVPIVLWDEIDNYIDQPQNYAPKEHTYIDQNLSKTIFALHLPESSMEPYFPKDSMLILDVQKQATDRSFILARLDETVTYIFRQLIIDGDQKYLKPMNPDLNRFPMRIMKDKDKIIAVLIEFRHRY